MSDLDPRLPLDQGVPQMAEALDLAIVGFAATAMRAQAIDPVTTELVRLRCAGHHDCRFCASLRLEEARDLGVNEEMTAKVSHYESSDLPERVKVALRLTDAVIIQPSGASPVLAAQLREHFSQEQIAELLLDIMKWSEQKKYVALRLEAPPWEGMNTLTFDEAGNHILGTAVAPA